MKNNILKKSLVFGILILFFGASVVSAINNNVKSINVVKEIRKLNRDIETFYPTDDTRVSHAYPEKNYGSDLVTVVMNDYGATGPGWAYDTLIRFDITSIPSNSFINSAVLGLYYYEWVDTNPAGRDLNLYKVTSEWNEETVTWNTQPIYASQSTTYSTVPPSTGVWMEWDVKFDVQDFVNGAEDNYGWKITDENYWGTYDIPRMYFRTKEYGNYIPYLEVEIIGNQPPGAPQINGQTTGKAGQPYSYTFVSVDPDDDDISYQIDWGDGTVDPWDGPYESNEIITKDHIWSEQGEFTIKARAKDINDEIGEWGTLDVTMPLIQQSFYISDPWWDNDWYYRKQITIDNNYVDDDLNSFPVLVAHTSSDLADNAQSDGDDFVFTTVDGTKLNHEIEKYDDSFGELVAWVNVPSVSSSVDTILYMYYGNPDCSSQQNVHGTWDSNYVGVWHMDDMTTSTIEDSTSNNIIGTKKDVNEPVEVTGKIARCQDFDGRVACDDYINCGHPPALDCTGYITVEMVVQLDSLPGGSPYVSDYCHLVRKDRCYTFYLINLGTVRFYYWPIDGTRYWGESSFTLSTGTWYHVAATFTSNGNQVELFRNGVKNTPIESTLGEAQDNTVDMMLGGREEEGHGGWTIDGRIDEFRISNIVRSDGWISTGYNNQINPETFTTFGEQEGTVLEIGNVTGGLFKANAVIKNVGQRDGGDVDYTISLNGGLILAGQQTFGIIESLPAGEQERVDTNIILGIGNTIITVKAEIETVSSDTKDADAFVLLFIIRMK